MLTKTVSVKNVLQNVKNVSPLLITVPSVPQKESKDLKT